MLKNLFDQTYMPHGYCLSWNTELLWLFVVSDTLIGVAYFTIPFALWHFARKRPDIRERGIIWLFGLFIIACGVTHVFDVINIWRPLYWPSAIAKALTALVSLITAIVLWRLMPAALAAPSVSQLEEANRKLAEAGEVLEQRVQRRTAALEHSEEQLRMVLEGAGLGFWDWNILTGEVERNDRWAEMLGYTHQEIRDTTQQWIDFIHPDDRGIAWQSIQAVLEGRAPSHRMEYRMLHKDGSVRWILDQANVMQRDAEGRPVRMSGIHTDITERKLMELRLEQQAHVDFLTGAGSRGHFMELAEAELSRAKRYGSALSLLMLDIDFFKQVNDTYGHKAGDEVLKNLVKRCRDALREVDIIGRVGGEEFAVLLPETAGAEALEAAERLRKFIETARQKVLPGMELQFTVSIGVSSLAGDESLDTLISRADKALYLAKDAGRNAVRQA